MGGESLTDLDVVDGARFGVEVVLDGLDDLVLPLRVALGDKEPQLERQLAVRRRRESHVVLAPRLLELGKRLVEPDVSIPDVLKDGPRVLKRS